MGFGEPGTTPEHPGTHHGAPRTRTPKHPGTARFGANAVRLQAKLTLGAEEYSNTRKRLGL
jgi:hypothetical protein